MIKTVGRWLGRQEHRDPMPAEFEELAVYNAEVARGRQHTPAWQADMANLQERFDEYTRTRCEQEGGFAIRGEHGEICGYVTVPRGRRR